MLPDVDALFTLVRQLARRDAVTEIAAPKWLVQRHGLAAMAARRGAISYREDLVRATVQWGRIEQGVALAVSAMMDAGVRVAPIKGVAYATGLYAHPAERPMNDADLLVQPARIDDARRVLGKVGFVRGMGAMLLHHAEPWVRNDLVIDLHWNIIAPGRSRIDLDGLWARTSLGRYGEQLDAEDALTFHLIHLARNRLRLPLVNVVDASRLMERADLQVVRQRARDWGLHAAVELALRLVTNVLTGKHRPAGFRGPSRNELADLSEPSFAQKVLFDVSVAGSPTQLLSRIVHFGANHWRKRR